VAPARPARRAARSCEARRELVTARVSGVGPDSVGVFVVALAVIDDDRTTVRGLGLVALARAEAMIT
jgi:hypothetical protein